MVLVAMGLMVLTGFKKIQCSYGFGAAYIAHSNRYRHFIVGSSRKVALAMF